jgi:hypothetical protein
MTTITPPVPSTPATDQLRRTSLASAILYLLTFVSIPTIALYKDARDKADLVLGFRPAAVAALPNAQAVR